MAKKKSLYVCKDCSYETTGYFGKCPSCGNWGSLEEKTNNEPSNENIKININKNTSKKLNDLNIQSESRIITDIGELNRVMGNGIIKDSVTILTAKPGAGKSTLLLQLAEDLSIKSHKVFYVSGEESESQIKNRAIRLNIVSNDIWIMSSNSINEIENEIEIIDPDIIIFDSIQTIVDENMTQKSGSPTQINEVSNRIVRISKYSNKKRASFIVGQMTKADELAGVRTLEHLVDCVLVLEMGASDQIRTLYSTKNRYGDTGEVGFFEMTEKGLLSIDNPSEFFVSSSNEGFGKALSVLKHGSRYVIGEVETLVSKSFYPYPQRISESVNRDNLNIIASILEETADIRLEDKNIILKATGGAKIKDVASDLSIAMSIASSYFKKRIDNKVVFCGEIGLTGEIKKTQNIKSRINEVSRLGYEKIVISKDQNIDDIDHTSIDIVKVKDLKTLIQDFF